MKQNLTERSTGPMGHARILLTADVARRLFQFLPVHEFFNLACTTRLLLQTAKTSVLRDDAVLRWSGDKTMEIPTWPRLASIVLHGCTPNEWATTNFLTKMHVCCTLRGALSKAPLNHYAPCLRELNLDYADSHPLEPGTLPLTLETLVLKGYNEQLLKGTLPPNLKELRMAAYNHVLMPDVLPASLRILIMSRFNQPLFRNSLPQLLETLVMTAFNCDLRGSLLPRGLRVLVLESFNMSLNDENTEALSDIFALQQLDVFRCPLLSFF